MDSYGTYECGGSCVVCLGLDAEWGAGSTLPEGVCGYGDGDLIAWILQRLGGDVLEKTRPAGYRWHGPVRHEGHDQQMRFLYCICGIIGCYYIFGVRCATACS